MKKLLAAILCVGLITLTFVAFGEEDILIELSGEEQQDNKSDFSVKEEDVLVDEIPLESGREIDIDAAIELDTTLNDEEYFLSNEELLKSKQLNDGMLRSNSTYTINGKQIYVTMIEDPGDGQCWAYANGIYANTEASVWDKRIIVFKNTEKPTVTPTADITTKPTMKATEKPTAKPTVKATTEPTVKPTVVPTVKPTEEPTPEPQNTPTPEITSIMLNRKQVTLYAGKALQLIASVAPEGVETNLTWASSNSKVAMVDGEGVVKALKKGTATITVTTSNGLSASCKITVPVAPTKVTLSKKSATLKVGKKIQLKASLTPTKAKTFFKWTSSNKKVATVTSKGVVKAIKPGKAKITVKTSNGKKATITITVKK